MEVDRLVHEEGMTKIPLFDLLDIVVGQGKLGLEIFEAVPEMVQVFVSVSVGLDLGCRERSESTE